MPLCSPASGQGESLRVAVGLKQPGVGSGLGVGSGKAALVVAVILLPIGVQSV